MSKTEESGGAAPEIVSAPLGELPDGPYDSEDAFRDALQMLKSAGVEYSQAAVRLLRLKRDGHIVPEPSLNGTGELAFTDRPTFTNLFSRFVPRIHLSDDVYPYLPAFQLKRRPSPEQRTQNAVLLAGILFHELFHLEHPPGRHIVNPQVIEPPAWAREIGFYQDLLRAHHGSPQLQALIRTVAWGREGEGRQHGYVAGAPRFGP